MDEVGIFRIESQGPSNSVSISMADNTGGVCNDAGIDGITDPTRHSSSSL
jgi:hypothetical protein